jgi:hypothetical protein
MTPDAWESNHLTNSIFHVCNLDFGILWSANCCQQILYFMLPAHLREIQVRLSWQNKGFGFDSLHGCSNITVVRLLI